MSNLFSKQVLTWFAQHGRKDLPWQKNITPYRVWISEIMLQQTQVKTVIPYYQRFMQRFANVKQLAIAPQDEVLHYWSGLGYYARARNLHKSAQIIHHDYKGRFPNTIQNLEALPGIGRSTAGAICAIAFKQPTSILDGNVKRVLSRYHAIQGWPGKTAINKQLWQLAEQHTPTTRTDKYTQAMMDLGATLCTRSKPQCQRCPLQTTCLALQQNCVEQLPTRKPKKALPQKHCQMLLIQHGHHVLLEQHPEQGIWGGLWGFPQLTPEQNAKQWSQLHFQQQFKACEHIDEFKHTFSHYQLIIQAQHIHLTHKPTQIQESNTQLWYDLQQPQAIGTAAIVPKLLQQLNNKR